MNIISSFIFITILLFTTTTATTSSGTSTNHPQLHNNNNNNNNRPFVSVDDDTPKYQQQHHQRISIPSLQQPPQQQSQDTILSIKSQIPNRNLLIRTALLQHQQQQQRNNRLQQFRGGATENVDDDDIEDDDDDDDEEDDLLDFGDDDDDDDSMLSTRNTKNEFDEATIIDRFIMGYQKTPPFTKLYLTISFVITMYGYVLNQNEFPSLLLLQWKKVITQFQFWRLVTSFFHFGPFGLGYIMTLQFVWVYMSTLERIHHNKPYDFWIMILFGQLCMVIGYPIMKLSPKFLGHNLSTFLVYIWSRYHEGVEVNMFELFNTRAEMLPWFFLGQTFLLEGEIPVLDFLGIVFGHIYHHCKTVGILRAPIQLTQWYETSDTAQGIRELYKPISSDFDAP